MGNTSLAHVRQETISEIVKLKQNCIDCVVTVTGGTEQTGGHNDGAFSHANGYKIDLRDSPSLYKYINDNAGAGADKLFLPMGKRSDGALQYKNNKTGAVYAYETDPNHWDVLVK